MGFVTNLKNNKIPQFLKLGITETYLLIKDALKETVILILRYPQFQKGSVRFTTDT